MYKKFGYARLNFLYLPIILCGTMISGCQTPISSEQEVVKYLPTDPVARSELLTNKPKDNIPKAGDPRYSPVRDLSPSVLYVPTGSLFHDDQYVGLFLQKKVYRIGDMVQVILEERTRASKNQELDKDKEGDLTIDPLEINAGPLKIARGDVSLDHKQSSSFSSSSKTNQSNSLQGMVNVFVNEILANGNLVVAGEKWIRLNEGDEYMRVYGEIRTQDIQANNTISSNMLGNAKIEYSGTGSLQDNQQYSIARKILSGLE